MKSNLYTIVYAAVLALVCATALTTVNELTKEAYQDNLAAKKARNIMRVLGIPFDANTPSKEIVKISEKKVKEDDDRAALYGAQHVYYSDHPEHGRLWAITFEGEGMWKPIEGLLCLKADLKTIHGITFYKQEETPGLGAKIAKAPFQNGFRGKTIYDGSGKPGILIKRAGTNNQSNEIDAITGASITSGKVQDMLNKLIDNIAKAERLLHEKNEKARKAHKTRVIMKVLDVSFDANASDEKNVEIREQKVKEDPAKAKLYGAKHVYFSDHPEHGRLWAVEFEGDGMWGPIKGLLCLTADMKTIHRITVYQQEEIPGMGSQIATASFQDGFRGKSIYDDSGKPGIVIKTDASGPNEVDAVSSATVTSGLVQDMLNKLIDNIAKAKTAGNPPEVSDGQ